jgi:hypothetical protein
MDGGQDAARRRGAAGVNVFLAVGRREKAALASWRGRRETAA